MAHPFSLLIRPVIGRSSCIRVAVIGLMLALAGCATVPPPDNSMNQAQAQLQAARDADAADYAPVDLGFAQDKFQQAQMAMAARKYTTAGNLAQESNADAELAQAKARLAAARAQIQSKVQENARLRDGNGEGDTTRLPDQPLSTTSDTPSHIAVPDMEDMPAPASSVLSAPGAGFQTVPEPDQPHDSSQATQTVPRGGQP